MKTCCQDIQDIQCSIPAIQERIVPIDFINNTMVVDSAISVENTLTIDGAEISTETGHIDIPARTLLNGVPLLSDAFLSQVINLPTDTILNGYAPTIEQYFYFFTATSSTFLLNFAPNGYMINGLTITTGTPTVDMRAFPFIAPEDCVLTSFKLLYVVSPGISGNAGNGRVSLDLIDKNFNPFFTGIAYDIIAPSNDSRTFFQSQFEYYLQKGDSVGIYVSGSAQFNGGVSIYATLGYRVIPPSLLSSSINISRHTMLRNSPSLSSLYNRFPFNQLMNFQRQNPISFEDQVDIIRSQDNDSKQIYGRSLTTQDYELRSMIPKDGPSVYQDAIAFLLNNLKVGGSFIDFSIYHKNTKQLEQDHDWTGILFAVNDKNLQERDYYISGDLTKMDYHTIFVENNMPNCIDYLSFDMEDPELARDTFEILFPMLNLYKFNFITIRHDGDPNVQSRTGNILLMYQYVRLFFNIMVETKNEWKVSEDWYVHPDLITSFPFIEKIITHPENVDNLRSTTCINIILSSYNE